MPVTADTLRLQRAIRVAVDTITDKQTRDLVAAWAEAWDEVAPDLTGLLVEMLLSGDRVTKAQLLRSERLKKALLVIADHLEALAGQAGVRILGDLRGVIDAAGGAQASVIDSQLPHNTAKTLQLKQWSQIDERAIQAIVKRSTQQIESRLRPLSADAQRAVRRELIRGVASGTNPRQTALRIVKRAEGKFNGGLTRALAIARTETLDAHRASALAGRLQNRDILAGWLWICELSKRACPACIAEHGSLHPVDEPGPNDHVNGRCTGMPTTKSWGDLGFDVPEPPSLVTDGSEWFEQQAVADQRAILGPSRYDAWKAGEYPMSGWSVTRGNDGWRDSVQVSRAPQSAGRSRSTALAS
jgi:hypothetical protein